MKFLIQLFLVLSYFVIPVSGQGLIIYHHNGTKDTVVANTIDSITFSQSIIIAKTNGIKDSVLLAEIDSVHFETALHPLPKITALNPSSASAGSPQFTLTVTGKQFLSNSVVQWNGTALSTEFVSLTELQAVVPASALVSPGNAAVTVFTPAPGGGQSAAVSFMIAALTTTFEGFEVGTKTSYAAAVVNLSSGAWNLDEALIGTSSSDYHNGRASARVRNGKMTMQFNLTTGAGKITILHASYGLDSACTWQLWYSTNSGNSWQQTGPTVVSSKKYLDTAVFTPNVSGLVRLEIRRADTSATVKRFNIDDITITSYGSSTSNPVPIITAVSPTSDTVGSANLVVTVTGNNFIASSQIVWNQTLLPTTFVSATTLKAAVPASNLTTPGVVNVSVFTPNGGSSTTVVFTINPGVNSPVPQVRYIIPVSCTPGRAGFTLAVTGSNFVNGSVVQWNGQALNTTYLSSTQLQAVIPAANVASLGTAQITVFTPPPSGGSSSAIPFSIITPVAPSTNINLTMGNPSNAVHDVNSPQNYLIERGQYCLSYHRDRGIANWVSWELDSSWLGTASRGSFKTDSTLPAGWYRVVTGDYSNTGLSRGHLCPSADRTRSEADNDTVFYMTNIIPQTQALNGGQWASLEDYERSLAVQGNKVYIICGVLGEGGTGLNGYKTSIANGKIAVPAKSWKVLMVLPPGTNDLARVDTTTRCFAVIYNNDLGPFPAWSSIRMSVDQLESMTGYDFFSNVPENIQAVIEAKVDTVPIP